MFKKKLITSAITASLMMGIASTSFAATNPFSDVPADSWAYDAVTTLANDGVIDGYPDGTYQGQNTILGLKMDFSCIGNIAEKLLHLLHLYQNKDFASL